ncbi:hypothetical protein ACWEV4_32635 [Streptomyces sp. NPDC003860]
MKHFKDTFLAPDTGRGKSYDIVPMASILHVLAPSSSSRPNNWG